MHLEFKLDQITVMLRLFLGLAIFPAASEFNIENHMKRIHLDAA